MKMEYIFIKQKDEYCVSKEMFKNFLCANKRIKFNNAEDNKSNIIIFDGQNLEYGLESTEVEKSNGMIFHLMVETQGKFQTSINSVIEKNNKTKNDINAEWLTYADFITLGYFFTAPYSMKTDLKALFKELKQYENIDISSNGEKQEDDESKRENKEKRKLLTADAIRKMSDEYEPKNNWDRYFSDKLSVKGPNKFSRDWSSLYDIRNKVAHGKPINEADFKKANELIKLFTTTFDECIEIIDTLDITVEEAEAVEAVAQQVIQKEQSDAFERENICSKPGANAPGACSSLPEYEFVKVTLYHFSNGNRRYLRKR